MPSEKVLEQKKQAVAELADTLKGSCAGVLVDYKGITVADDTVLRKELRDANVKYTVVKNTLLGLAFKEAELQGLEQVLAGTTAIRLRIECLAFSAVNPSSASPMANSTITMPASTMAPMKIAPVAAMVIAPSPLPARRRAGPATGSRSRSDSAGRSARHAGSAAP